MDGAPGLGDPTATCSAELPVLRDRLPGVQTPVRNIAGDH